jgi:hypothetical protein
MEHSNMVVLEKLAHAALGLLGERLLALSEKAGGDLGVEARRARMLARMPLMSASQIERALELAGSVASFVDNWSDCARHGHETPEAAGKRYSEAARSCHELAAADGAGKRDQSATGLVLLAGATLLSARGQELNAREEPEAERRDREFDEECLDPAKAAATAAVAALCALADGWEREEFDGR